MEESPFKGKTGLARIIQAAGNSADGLKATFRLEDAFRQEVLASIILIPLALWLGNDGLERALMASVVLLVLIMELVNSAVEATVDRVSLDRHPLAKRAKDIASATVMLALANALVVWSLILVERL